MISLKAHSKVKAHKMTFWYLPGFLGQIAAGHSYFKHACACVSVRMHTFECAEESCHLLTIVIDVNKVQNL